MGKKRRRAPAPAASAAEVRFVPREDGRVRIYVHRPDGTETTWTSPGYGTGLPHDLVHLVVERHLGVQRGLWGLVARGIEIERVNAMANRHGGADKWHLLGDDIRELMWAETLANQPWYAEPFDDARIETELREAANELGEAAEVPEAEVRAAIRAEIRAVHEQWRSRGVSEALVQSFPVRD